MADFILSAFADEAASDIDGQIDALKRNNLKYIEIRNVDGINIADLGTAVISEIHKKLDGNGIGVSAIGSYIGKISITDPFAPHLDAFKRTLEAASILETKKIRLFSFFIPKNEKAENYRNEVIDRIGRLIILSEAEGIDSCHENEKEIYGDTKDRTVDLLSSFKGRLKGIFDPANYIQCGELPDLIFDGLFEFIDYMHIKDALSADGTVVPSGFGDSNMSGLIEKFSKAEGGRFLTVEPHLTLFDGFANLKDNTLKSKFTYANSNESFDAAVNALKFILNKRGCKYE